MPVAALIARKIASTGPSPVNEPVDLLAVGRADADGRVRRAARRGLDVEPLELVAGDLLAQLVGDQRLEVHRGDVLLLVRDLLEALEGRVQRLAGDLEAQLGSACCSAWRPECLPSTIELASSPTVVASMIS